MPWWGIALIIYGIIGFLVGIFCAIIDWDGGGVVYIVPCVFIGVPLLLVGILEWMILGEG